jgi:hypothetical protein
MFRIPLGFANRPEKWSEESAQRPMLICAARFGAGSDSEEAGAVVVSEFEDEVEIGLAEQGSEFQVCNPIAVVAFYGVRVCGRENTIDLWTSIKNGIAGFTHEDPNLSVGEFGFCGYNGGREQKRVADMPEFDKEDSHTIVRPSFLFA